MSNSKTNKKQNADVKVNVMMFGGRRCGKTSVIAAMKRCIEEKFGEDSHLVITYDFDTLDIITKKEKEIKNFLGSEDKIFIPNEGNTKDKSEYNFNISLKGKKGNIKLTFIDYPGEWLNNSDKQDTLKKLVEKSNIFMIAIDTPMLMEQPDKADPNEIGRFNDAANRSQNVCNILKSVLNGINADFTPFIMFVPLKCEKYYDAKKMTEVNKKVHAAYKTLFDFLGGEHKKRYEAAITPILTFGKNTARFSKFECDNNGEIIVGEDELPEKSWYIRESTTYSPLYCDQPLLYSLAYLLHMAQKQKEKESKNQDWFTKLFVSIFGDFFKLPNANDFIKEKDIIRKKLIKDDKDAGYEMVHNPIGL